MNLLLKILFLGTNILLSLRQDAYAYLNPGIGSLILQGLLGFLFVALAVGGIFWNRIKRFLDRVLSKNDKS